MRMVLCGAWTTLGKGNVSQKGETLERAKFGLRIAPLGVSTYRPLITAADVAAEQLPKKQRKTSKNLDVPYFSLLFTVFYYFSLFIKTAVEIHIVFKEVSYLWLIFTTKSSIFINKKILNLS